MKTIDFYSNKVVTKPWGYEYVIYNNKRKLAVTFLKINHGHKTSLHCHPQKKTGFIILSGKAQVQIGIYKKNKKNFSSLSRLVFRAGLFHSLKAVSKRGLYALEFETPYNKKDLVRFEDSYGRQKKHYEGKKFTKNIDSSFLKFKDPKIGKKNNYIFNDLNISIEVTKNLKSLTKKDDRSTCAILNGNLKDNGGQDVIAYGEIIKTSTLRILSDKFKIKKPLTILKVSKKN
jgi:mannose-6-phosphate isomerase-like protein (cupin superfamily)